MAQRSTHLAPAAALWLLAACCLQAVDTPPPPAAPTPLAHVAAAPSFQQQLDALAKDEHSLVGICIRDLATGDTFTTHADTPFSQTGLAKLHILIALYREADAGRIDLSARHTLAKKEKLPGGILHRLGDDTVTMTLRDYALLMSVMDDNTAANILLEKIGTQAVENSLAALGTSEIRFAGLVTAPENPEDNTATPRALSLCLNHLYEAKTVTPKSRDDIFAILATPRASSLRSGIPNNIKVSNKAGFRGPLRCSAGIVFLPAHPYSVVIMMRPAAGLSAHPDAKLGEKIAAISRLAYTHFSSLEKAAPSSSAPPETAPPPTR